MVGGRYSLCRTESWTGASLDTWDWVGEGLPSRLAHCLEISLPYVHPSGVWQLIHFLFKRNYSSGTGLNAVFLNLAFSVLLNVDFSIEPEKLWQIFSNLVNIKPWFSEMHFKVCNCIQVSGSFFQGWGRNKPIIVLDTKASALHGFLENRSLVILSKRQLRKSSQETFCLGGRLLEAFFSGIQNIKCILENLLSAGSGGIWFIWDSYNVPVKIIS